MPRLEEKQAYQHDYIRRVIQDIRAFFRKDGREPEVYVSCGSRQTGDQKFKHSYHIAVENYVFASNHDGYLKAVALELAATAPVWRPDGSKEDKSIIDTGIYTRFVLVPRSGLMQRADT
jgi:hypothetical protein